jgi:mannose-6-phosphate isomerase-like protein (cupin superfamily)
MTATTISPARDIPPADSYGVITNDTGGLGEIRNLVGGTGTARWKQLINGMHLAGAWGPVEYVELPPGASCGDHLHAEREEIYYIVDGSAVMHVNGQDVEVAAGDLITCPLGTVHGIGVPGEADQPMHFFVVELFPHQGPPRAAVRIGVRDQLQPAPGYRGYTGDDVRVARVDLTRYFTGPWRSFTEIEVPADTAVSPYQAEPGTVEVLFVTEGEAELTAGSQVLKGGHGLCLGSSLGSSLTVRNPSSSRVLRLISTQVAA